MMDEELEIQEDDDEFKHRVMREVRKQIPIAGFPKDALKKALKDILKRIPHELT